MSLSESAFWLSGVGTTGSEMTNRIQERKRDVRDERHAERVANTHRIALPGFDGTGQQARVRAGALVNL